MLHVGFAISNSKNIDTRQTAFRILPQSRLLRPSRQDDAIVIYLLGHHAGKSPYHEIQSLTKLRLGVRA